MLNENKLTAANDFTSGPILSKMLRFMIPILGALILQAAYGAVDIMVVGRFGTTEGISGVSTGSNIMNLFTFVLAGFATSVTVLIAKYLGEKNRRLHSFLFLCWNYFYCFPCSFCTPDCASYAGSFRSD